MLKLKALFLPIYLSSEPASYNFLFAGLVFKLPSDFPLRGPCFYAAYDRLGLTVSTAPLSYSPSAKQFISTTGDTYLIAPYGIIPQDCLDTYFGPNAYIGHYKMTYPLHNNWNFFSEDIDAMIDAIAPQATLAKDN